MKNFLLFFPVCFFSIVTSAQIGVNTDWTWMKGDTLLPQYGVYGTQGIAAASNKPGARNNQVSWKDASGNIWIFGGNGFSENSSGRLNDLWKYDPSTTQWTWISGDNTINAVGVYGMQGTADAANKPGARYGSISWKDASGNFWLFGGSGNGGDLNDLWKYNPSTNQWTWINGDNTINSAGVYGTQGIPASGSKPGARYESISWTDGAGNFWLFGGNGYAISGPDVLNDLWKYNPSANQWTWMKGDNATNVLGVYGTLGTADPANKPGGRELSVSWLDSSGKLWLYGGGGYAASGSAGDLSDLWKYDPSTNNWVWMKGNSTTNSFGNYGTQGVAAAANKPGAGRGGTTWTDASGNLWLLGGVAYTNFLTPDIGLISDLFKYDPATNKWTWVKGNNTVRTTGVYGTQGVPDPANRPGARWQNISWVDPFGNFWIYGGEGHTSSGMNSVTLNDIWKYEPATNNWTWTKGAREFAFAGNYGMQGVAAPSNNPGARNKSVTWSDGSNNLWLFGGDGYAVSGSGNLNDLWKYSHITNQWTWVKGDNVVNGVAVYGTQGTADAANKPGARYGSVSWKDASGNLWLFGGYGRAGSLGYLNDLWKYSPSTNQWAWMKGNSTPDGTGIYGTMGTANAANNPGARRESVSWTDTSGNLWLLGGEGYPASGSSGYLNDLWKYNPSTNQWTWMKGDNTLNVFGVYGTKGTSGPANKPGSRNDAVSWADAIGNLWLFGGYGYPASVSSGKLNDLWKYNTSTNEWTWMKGDNFREANPVYGGIAPGTPSDFTKPGSRYGAISWIDNFGKLWLFGGFGNAASAGGDLNDLWKYDPAANQWTWTKGDNSSSQYGVYGAPGTPGYANKPGSREYAASWKDPGGNLWLFGGNGLGVGNPGYNGLLNDLWKLGTNSTVPVTLLNISAQLIQKNVALSWQTAQEINTSHFIIQRSEDGVHFENIGRVLAVGNSITLRSYNFTDDKPLTGNNHYRLKIIDNDGNYKYSNVILIRNAASTGIAFYPNPVKNTLLAKLDGVNPGKVLIHLSDITGRQLFSAGWLIGANQQINISMSPYPKGVYVIEVKDITGKTLAKQKIIKD